MKGKAFTYLLIAAVAAVWVTIIYRVVVSLNNDDEVAAVTGPVNKETYNDLSYKKDTSKLMLNYHDPFGQVAVKDTAHLKAIPSKAIMSLHQTQVALIDWSTISYFGFIRNPETKQLLAMMKINGKMTTLAEGESAGPVKLLKNLKDSVKIAYKGKTKFITTHAVTP